MVNRKAFTLIEVLISIALMGLILVPLFSVVEMMRNSNDQLLHSLEKSTQITKATKVLFLDIMSSDGNFTLKKDEMSRFCMEETSNSLYGLPVAKVCWLVLKEKNTLVRAEGNDFKLPLTYDDKVEVDKIIPSIEIFDVTRDKDKVLVVIKQKEKEPISFLVQGIYKPVPPLGPFIRDKNGKILYNADGTPRRYPSGTVINAQGRAINKSGKDITYQGATRRPSRGAPKSTGTNGKNSPNTKRTNPQSGNSRTKQTPKGSTRTPNGDRDTPPLREVL